MEVGATLPGGPGKASPQRACLKKVVSHGEVAERTAFQAEGTAAAKCLRQKWAQRGDRKPACRWQRKWHPPGLPTGLSSSLFTLSGPWGYTPPEPGACPSEAQAEQARTAEVAGQG